MQTQRRLTSSQAKAGRREVRGVHAAEGWGRRELSDGRRLIFAGGRFCGLNAALLESAARIDFALSLPDKSPMSTTADITNLREDLLALPVSTRALLAQDLLESLDSKDDAGGEQAWFDLAEQRLDELKSGKVKAIPGPEVLRRARDRNR